MILYTYRIVVSVFRIIGPVYLGPVVVLLIVVEEYVVTLAILLIVVVLVVWRASHLYGVVVIL